MAAGGAVVQPSVGPVLSNWGQGAHRRYACSGGSVRFIGRRRDGLCRHQLCRQHECVCHSLFLLFLTFLVSLAPVSVFVNQPGGGAFRSQTLASANGPFGIVCIDINRDGRKDLVWGNDGRQGAVDNTLSYVLNQGFDGSAVMFSAPVLLTIGFNPSDIAVADFDKNGADDLVITLTDNNQVAVLYNLHNGNASSPVAFAQARCQSVGSLFC